MDWHKGMHEVRDMRELDRMGVPERYKAADQGTCSTPCVHGLCPLNCDACLEHGDPVTPPHEGRLPFWEAQAARGTSGDMVWGILADWRKEREGRG